MCVGVFFVEFVVVGFIGVCWILIGDFGFFVGYYLNVVYFVFIDEMN